MEEKTLLDKLIVQGGIDALYGRADTLSWELRNSVEMLSRFERDNPQRYPGYRSKIGKITELIDRLEGTLDRVRSLEERRLTGIGS